jgi:hypothetical protein
MRLQRFEARVVEGLDRGLLDGPVHPLGLAIRPGVVGLGEPVLDAVLAADAVEDVGAQVAPRRPVPVLRQVGEGHAVVGEHGVDRVGERRDDLPQEGGAVHLGVGVEESDVDELRDPVDGQEHEQLALGQAQLADVDVDVADRRLGEAAALRGLLLVPRQTGNAVPRQAAVERAAAEGRDSLAQAAQDVIERQQGAATELHDHRLFGLGQDGAAGFPGAHRRVGGAGPAAPLGHGLGVQPVAVGQGPGARLRRLELGSNTRRRSG